MRVRRLFHFFIYLFVAVLVVFIGYSIYVYVTNKPPVEEITQARESLAQAKNKSAGKYAGETLKEAEQRVNKINKSFCETWEGLEKLIKSNQGKIQDLKFNEEMPTIY